jgi:hypothetical protein
MHRDPKCIYVANSPGEADVVAVWLEEQGFPSRVMNMSTLGGLPGLTPFSPLAIGAGGIEVWVLDEVRAPQAKQLLDEHSETLAKHTAALQHGAPIQVNCEECGQSSEFPAKERGSVQECPHCGAYLDVGDPGQDELSDDETLESSSENGDNDHAE